MTLLAYQRALSDMIASPALCLAVRADAAAALACYALSPRERRRLAVVATQPGMSTSCTLYRLNRVTPLVRYLPLTTTLLGDALVSEAERFWAEGAPTDLQFGPEAERFAAYLRSRIDAGALDDPYLPDVLALELSVNRLRIATGAEPLIETVVFRHDPLPLLSALSDGHRPDPVPSQGRFELVVDATSGDIELLPGRSHAFVGADPR